MHGNTLIHGYSVGGIHVWFRNKRDAECARGRDSIAITDRASRLTSQQRSELTLTGSVTEGARTPPVAQSAPTHV